MRNQKKGGNLSSVNDIGFVVFCERIEMKNWTKPEIKMYGIRMDENIASSVGGSVPSTPVGPALTRVYISFRGDGRPFTGGLYYCTEDRNVHSTGITYDPVGWWLNYVDSSQAGNISGCRV